MPYKTKEARQEHYAKNRERLNAARKAWAENNPEKVKAADARRLHSPARVAWTKSWRIKNAEHIRARRRKWNAENPEKVKEMKLAYYYANRDKILAKMKRRYNETQSEWYLRVRRWKRKNWDKEHSYQKKYSEKNKEKAKLRTQKRLRLQLGQTEGCEDQIVELCATLKSSKDTKCFYCHKSLFGMAIHIDHIVPISKGGAHAVHNLCASCPECNLSKGSKSVDDWRLWKMNVEPLEKAEV